MDILSNIMGYMRKGPTKAVVAMLSTPCPTHQHNTNAASTSIEGVPECHRQ
jgi:hypothetical protein